MSGFDYEVEHVKSKENVADPLSRLRYKERVSGTQGSEDEVIRAIKEIGVPINLDDLKRETSVDVEMQFCWGNLATLNCESFVHYYRRKDELSFEQGILLWGHRVVVPTVLRKYVLQELHSGHQGIVKMKSKARKHFWWPEMEKAIEAVASNCEACAGSRDLPPKSPLIPWPITEDVWKRIHVDYMGPLYGYQFLIVIDSKSKWLEVFMGTGNDSKFTIECLREYFARFGLVDTVVSDNGACFTSKEFREFLKANGIYQGLIAPGHPSTNGLAEKAVGTVKKALTKVLGRCPQTRPEIRKVLQNFLFEYRNTPHSTTEMAPAEMMLGHPLKDALSRMLPEQATQELALNRKALEKNIMRQIESYGGRRKQLFSAGEEVLVRDFRDPIKKRQGWMRARILKCMGKRHYLCRLSSGQQRKCNVEQMRKAPRKTVQLEWDFEQVFKDNIPETGRQRSHETSTGTGKAQEKNATKSGKQFTPSVAVGGRLKDEDDAIDHSEGERTMVPEQEEASLAEETTQYFELSETDPVSLNFERLRDQQSTPKLQGEEINDLDLPVAVRRTRRDIRPPERLDL